MKNDFILWPIILVNEKTIKRLLKFINIKPKLFLMEILPGIEIVDLALWLQKEKILVISDLHLGYEGELEERGFFIPKFQLKDVLQGVGKILKKIKPEKIIISGDMKHNYGQILKQEWRDVLKLVDFLLDNCRELILIRGNHDLFLGPLAGKRNVKLVESYQINDFFVCHGDKIKTIDPQIKNIIIGHEHPAIILKDKNKSEKFKCFLKGKFKRKNLVVIPSFNPLSDGASISKTGIFSPYLPDLSNFQVYVVGEKVYDFGKVKDLPTS
tara:strand:+ start:644 stop:1450 length:807 start_codon:yes stop_codon:yes gene_type:complete